MDWRFFEVYEMPCNQPSVETVCGDGSDVATETGCCSIFVAQVEKAMILVIDRT